MANQTLAEQVRMARLNFRRVRGQVTSVVNSVRVTVNAYRDRGEARRSERIRRTRQYRLYVPEYVQSEAPPFSQPVVDSTNGPRPTKLVASDVQGRINTVSNLMKNDSEVKSSDNTLPLTKGLNFKLCSFFMNFQGLGRGRFVDSNLSMEGGSSGLSGGDVTGGMTAGIDGNSSRSGMNHCRKHTRNVSVGNYILEGAASAKSKDEPNAGEVEPVPTYKVRSFHQKSFYLTAHPTNFSVIFVDRRRLKGVGTQEGLRKSKRVGSSGLAGDSLSLRQHLPEEQF